MIATVITGVLLLIVIFWAIATYNGLIQLRENVKNGWSQIDVQLKRRHDLVPNLVETAKGYMTHEKGTLEQVIKARQMAVDASTLPDKLRAENALTGTLRSLMAVAENYPNLKADQHMMRLQEELTSTENKIAFARQYYNDETNRLNVAIQTFPDSFIAQFGRFEKASFFELENVQERQAPQVKF
jgi:LemA protein